MSRQILRGRLFSPSALRRPDFSPAPLQWPPSGSRPASSIPAVAQLSFWKSLVPKPLRSGRSAAATVARLRSGEWNPATFFIAIFLLIGSMSIQMISLKKSFAAFVRQSDVRIGVLREVVEKIQRGEDVDVEKALGTGDPEREVEWQEVLDEIGKEDLPRDRKRKSAEKKQDGRKQAETTPAQHRREEPPSQEDPSKAATHASSPSRASFF